MPYKGSAYVMQTVLDGRLEAMSEASWAPMAQQGKLRPLAVYADKRNPLFPRMPALKELGWNVVTQSTAGIAGPHGMCPKVVAALQDVIRGATEDPDLKKTQEVNGQQAGYMDSTAYTRFVKAQFQVERRNVEELKAAGVPLGQ